MPPLALGVSSLAAGAMRPRIGWMATSADRIRNAVSHWRESATRAKARQECIAERAPANLAATSPTRDGAAARTIQVERLVLALADHGAHGATVAYAVEAILQPSPMDRSPAVIPPLSADGDSTRSDLRPSSSPPAKPASAAPAPPRRRDARPEVRAQSVARGRAGRCPRPTRQSAAGRRRFVARP